MRTYILLLLASVSLPALAQPALNADFAYVVGTRYDLRTNAEPASLVLDSGAAQNWVVSLSSTEVAMPTEIQAPTTVRGIAELDSANVRVRVGGTLVEELGYYSNTPQGVQYRGVDVPRFNFTSHHKPAPFVLRFGTPFQGRWQQTYEAVLGRTQAVISVVSNSYSGYGTLMLNGTSYPGCILITTRGESFDTAGGVLTSQGSYVDQRIYTPGIGSPILSISDIGSATPYIVYMEGIVSSTRPAIRQLAVSPNPATDRLCLQGHLLRQATAVGADGHRHALPCPAGQADVSGLPPGLFLLEGIEGGAAVRARFMKQ